MEDNWNGIKEVLTSTCRVMGLKKRHYKEWISIETPYKIQERKNKKTAIHCSRTRTEKVKAQAEYTESDKQMKRGPVDGKEKYVEDLVMMAEKLQQKDI
ncbi:unnamed protein product [Schistosoma mattheei]|uniref:Uncharacterized protein n=1 Tax=Schistosoma mattheei TaxID=31246 RepID=A0A183PBA3_9TREM|nr:unnamed protein product [Schistosoma mattheei]